MLTHVELTASQILFCFLHLLALLNLTSCDRYYFTNEETKALRDSLYFAQSLIATSDSVGMGPQNL